MALIVEVVRHGRGGGMHERIRFGAGPLTIGRALDNALVLDDPHVDAHHARLVRAEDGSVVIEDLGSVNRIEADGEGRRDRVVVAHGTVLTLGRTTLRFREELAPVPAAIPLAGVTRGGGSEQARWCDRTAGRAGIIGAALLVGAVDQWLGSPERGAASTAFTFVLSASALAIVWAGVWSVASRAVLGQFRLLAHITVAALAYLAFTLLGTVDEWGRFLFPGATFSEAIWTGFALVLFAAVVAGHLASASHLARAQRWRVGAVASAIVLVLLGVSAFLDEGKFTSVAEFPGVIKPLAPALVPTQSVEEFAATIADLRAEVDSVLAARER